MKQKKEMTCCIAVNALGKNDVVGRNEFESQIGHLISYEGWKKVT